MSNLNFEQLMAIEKMRQDNMFNMVALVLLSLFILVSLVFKSFDSGVKSIKKDVGDTLTAVKITATNTIFSMRCDAKAGVDNLKLITTATVDNLVSEIKETKRSIANEFIDTKNSLAAEVMTVKQDFKMLVMETNNSIASEFKETKLSLAAEVKTVKEDFKILVTEIKESKKEFLQVANKATSEITSVKTIINQSANKTIGDRCTEIYNEYVATPQAIMLIAAGCGFLIREIIVRSKRKDKEALDKFKASAILKIFDAMLAALILPALFTNGIAYAVTAWKQACTLIYALKTMLSGYSLVKSMFGEEVKMSVMTDTAIVEESIDTVVNRVSEKVKEAIEHDKKHVHDRSNDAHPKFHICVPTCVWEKVTHANTCGITDEMEKENTVFYKCLCHTTKSGETLPSNATDTPTKNKYLIDGQIHYNCEYARKCHIMVLTCEKQSESDKLDFPVATCCQRKVVIRNVVNTTYTVQPMASPVLDKVLGPQVNGQYRSEKNGKDEVKELKPDEHWQVVDYLISRDEQKKKNAFTQMTDFLKKNDKYVVVGCIGIVAILFAWLIYSQKSEKKGKSKSTEAITKTSTKKKKLPTIEKIEESDETIKKISFAEPIKSKEGGKAADARRAATRASKKHISRPIKPWWEYVREREQMDSDFSVEWRSRQDVEKEIAEEEAEIERALAEMDKQAEIYDRMGYDSEAKEKLPYDPVVVVKEAQRLVNIACRYGKNCKHKDTTCKKLHLSSFSHALAKSKADTLAKVDKQLKKSKVAKPATGKKSVKKEALHNGDQMQSTKNMREALGWCETNTFSQCASRVWNGFVTSDHVYGESDTMIKVSFMVKGKIMIGTFNKDQSILIDYDTRFYQWIHCVDNDEMKQLTSSGIRTSIPKVDSKVTLVTFNSYDDFVNQNFKTDVSVILDNTKHYEGDKVYWLGKTKNSSVSGNCSSSYFNSAGQSVGFHNSKDHNYNYFVAVNSDMVFRATGSRLNW